MLASAHIKMAEETREVREMWVHAESTDKPIEVDDASSRDYVYVRRNITHVTGDSERPDHWGYDELSVPRESFELWEQQEVNSSAIAEVASMGAESLDMVDVLSQAVEELASIIGGE
jgi:hypothetical protein